MMEKPLICVSQSVARLGPLGRIFLTYIFAWVFACVLPLEAQTTITFEETSFAPQNQDSAGRYYHRGTTWLSGEAASDQNACQPVSCLSSPPLGFRPGISGNVAFAQVAFDQPQRSVRFHFAATPGASGTVRAFTLGGGQVAGADARTPTAAEPSVFVSLNPALPIVRLEIEGRGTLFIDDFRFTPASNATLSFNPSILRAQEGESVVVQVKRNGEGSSASARVVVVGGTAKEGVDFSFADGSVSFPPGTGGTQRLTVDLLTDNVSEAEESIVLELQEASGASIATGTARILVTDPPAARQSLAFREAVYSGVEGEALQVEVERSNPSATPLEIAVVPRFLSGDPIDLSLRDSILTWASGESGPKSLTVDLVADSADERVELALLEILPSGSAGVEFEIVNHAVVVVEDEDRVVDCDQDPEALCLANGRFRVFAEWKIESDGRRGLAAPIPATDDSGLFWFFSPSNTELVVKALDGRPINDSFWVFYGALSDVRYWLVVVDEITGDVRVYENPPGNFCGQADTRAFPQTTTQLQGSEGGSAVSRSVPEDKEMTRSEASAEAICAQDDLTLCVEDGRYSVRTERIDRDSGQFLPATVFSRSAEGGIFWFFEESNLELVVKLLNGSSINGHEWFFYGALSDVQYRILVTDHILGTSVTYENPAGEICGQADIEALDRE